MTDEQIRVWTRALEKRIHILWEHEPMDGMIIEDAARALIASVRAEAIEGTDALAKFGDAVLEEARADFGDLDGGWIQDKAEELGILVRVTVTEPCGEYCRCAEYDDFPQECLRRALVKERKGEE